MTVTRRCCSSTENDRHDKDCPVGVREAELADAARRTAQWQRDIAAGHGPLPVFRVTLDIAEPEDLEFRNSVARHGIAMRFTGVTNPSYEYEFTALTREALVGLIEVELNDGSGDMAYLTDLIEESTVTA